MPERPIEPTEILPRSSSRPPRHPSRADQRKSLRRPPAAPLPMLTSAAVAGGVVAGGVATAVALGGIKAAMGLVRLLGGGSPERRPTARAGVVFGYSASASISSGRGFEWTHVEVRWAR